MAKQGRPPVAYRRRLLKMFNEGCSYGEIAREVGSTYDAVRQVVARARAKGLKVGPRRRAGRLDPNRPLPPSLRPYYRKLYACGFKRPAILAAIQAGS